MHFASCLIIEGTPISQRNKQPALVWIRWYTSGNLVLGGAFYFSLYLLDIWFFGSGWRRHAVYHPLFLGLLLFPIFFGPWHHVIHVF